MGFGVGTGLFLAQIIFILIGMALFIPGLMLINKNKKDNNDAKDSTYYIGITLMILGVAISGGLGGGILFDSLDF